MNQNKNWIFVKEWILSCETLMQLVTISEFIERDTYVLDPHDKGWLFRLIDCQSDLLKLKGYTHP